MKIGDAEITFIIPDAQLGPRAANQGQAYYFLGPNVDSLSFFYRGNIQPEVEYSDIFKKQTLKVETIQGDKFYFLSLSQDPTNHLIHELAHQWWGGLVSWNSYEDIWITEGFSQFSLLHYLEKKSNPKQFERILKRLKR